MTTYTIFGAVSDGYVRSFSETSYAIARAGTESLSAVGSDLNIGQRDFAGEWSVYEAFVDFVTSVVLGTISSAVLSLYLKNDNSIDTDFTIEARIRDWGTTLETADYVAGASLSALTSVATLATSGIGATGAYKAFVDVAMVANVNQAGSTRMLISSSRTRLNNAALEEEYVIFADASTSGTTNDPKLVVEATSVGGAVSQGTIIG